MIWAGKKKKENRSKQEKKEKKKKSTKMFSIQRRDEQTFSVKGQRVNVCSFVIFSFCTRLPTDVCEMKTATDAT